MRISLTSSTSSSGGKSCHITSLAGSDRYGLHEQHEQSEILVWIFTKLPETHSSATWLTLQDTSKPGFCGRSLNSVRSTSTSTLTPTSIAAGEQTKQKFPSELNHIPSTLQISSCPTSGTLNTNISPSTSTRLLQPSRNFFLF